ncbi:MAG TPA: bifunctional riboflavin kinase/FAD synthetase [Thermoanaerobaculia bacterium]|nr:bifunctional riboflavin kinase/FAD synthetase [Thermoanaerobaculia bacterium]
MKGSGVGRAEVIRVVTFVRGEERAGELPRGGVVTIGNYDGIHRGQRAVLDGVVARAREIGAPALVVTFDPHPLAVLDPPRAPQRIASDAQRERLFAAAGVDAVWVVPFTAEFARRPAADFVRDLLVDRLGVREVHVGSRFGFGRARGGNLELLERMGAEHGFAVRGVPELDNGGEPISSTRIRAALAAGEVEKAAALLGRPFARGGRVVAGDHLGRRIGWPTANLAADTELLPAHGVYAAKLRRLEESGPALTGVANVGVRPTRGGDAAPRVEIHLFDFDAELYGEEVEIEFHHRLRGERRFPSLDALAEQIAADAAAAREYFSGPGRSGESAGGRI